VFLPLARAQEKNMRTERNYWRGWLLVGLLVALAFHNTVRAAGGDRAPLTAVLGAMPDEVHLLESRLQDKQVQEHLGMKFFSGTLVGRRVVVAYTGIGKVNAAMTTTLVLDHYQPAEVLFTGVAGGINTNLGPGDIVLGERVAQHDFGEVSDQNFQTQPTDNPRTGQHNPLFFAGADRLLAVAGAAAQSVSWEQLVTTQGARTPQVRRGVIVTGDVFVASPVKCAELRTKFKADAVEMEGGAVAQVCAQQGVPCLVIRSLSDRADATANLDFKKFFQAAAANSAHLTEAILRQLAAGTTP